MMFKKVINLMFITVLLLSAWQTSAQVLDSNTTGALSNNVKVLQTGAGYDPNVTVGSVVASVIKTFLGLLGVIFVILIIIAGVKWMTAGGDEEKVKAATQTISRAVIGLIIVIAAYSITYFVFKNLPMGATTGTTSG